MTTTKEVLTALLLLSCAAWIGVKGCEAWSVKQKELMLDEVSIQVIIASTDTEKLKNEMEETLEWTRNHHARRKAKNINHRGQDLSNARR